ncbi:Serine/threonine-protein kinase PknB [Aquisphaera giovannonii]|uniref:Serine/threonine-protein kinase PknB n=1 Tax=Aquisphaera giovannonii TaxID=406548 RepID=A0A5B9VUU2_9BACT|nr:protein kinase [Aquisphaera giovannonii]QEH31560.1 Serine/threonine-protein kinase PknB [Aquisphaera giovannonii]
MGDATTCRACGGGLAAPAGLGGLCPACLLRQGLGGSTAGGPELGVTVGPTDPDALARLGESLGGLPSVLLRDTDPESGPEPVVAPASPEMPPTDDRPGRFQLFGEIARGGMGAVLKARDPGLGRELAIKVLLERHRDNPDLVRRFVEEAQIGGQLQHPGVVPIYDLGAFADARPYFAMKLVKGRTLADLLEERPSPADDLPRFLSAFEQVCQTMAYAHARGVIHRDLKPSNVMVGSFGEVQVMDWGLAKVLARGGVADERAPTPEPAETVVATARSGSGADDSRPGSVLGTPAYMPPEQARGDTRRVDERADVFALGSILCELLTGDPAYAGGPPAEVLRRAADAELADAEARLAACGADPELVALARACLAPAPEARPRDARAVANAVTAHLAGVQERLRAAELERAQAQARAEEERKRRRLAVGLAASVLLTVGLGLGGWAWDQSRRRATDRRFESSLADASALLGRARGSGGDASAWAAARTAAGDLAALAAPAGLGPELSSRIARLRDDAEREAAAVAAEAEAARRDGALIDALASARSMQAELGDAETIDALRAALAASGVDVAGAGDPAAAVRPLENRPEDVRMAAAAGLDEWAFLARVGTAKLGDEAWKRPLALAEALDPEPTRLAVRRAWAAADQAELRRLAAPESVDRLRPASVLLLAGALRDAKGARDHRAAAAVVRRGLLNHPRDARLNEALAEFLAEGPPESRAEAMQYYRIAWALQPACGYALAALLKESGRAEEAERILRELAGIRGTPIIRGTNLHKLGQLLGEQGRSAEAAAALAEAEAEFRAAVRLRPDDAGGHIGLAMVLHEAGRSAETESELRTAIRLRPDDRPARFNLGLALIRQGRLADAEAELRAAVRLRPNDLLAHDTLGSTLQARGKLAEAEAEFRAAIGINPDDPLAHFNLGLVLQGLGRMAEAQAEALAAVRLQPDDPDSLCSLGLIRAAIGKYDEALADLRRGHEIGSKRPGWTNASGEWVRRTERQALLAKRLPAVLRGDDRPADADEGVNLALMAHDRRRYATAARLFSDALRADPKLADDRHAVHAYNAACSAALAAAGRGEDAPKLDDARATLRAQALGWLQSELAAWSGVLRSGTPTARLEVLRTLQHWQQDTDLAALREPEALAGLPGPERAKWKALWVQVDRLLEKAAKAP